MTDAQSAQTALDKLIEAVEAGGARAADFAPCFVNGMNSPYWDARRAFAGSLDAALALHEALLPGWNWEICSDMPDRSAAVWIDPKQTVIGGWDDNNDPARAWLLAILRAYRSIQA